MSPGGFPKPAASSELWQRRLRPRRGCDYEGHDIALVSQLECQERTALPLRLNQLLEARSYVGRLAYWALKWPGSARR